MAEVRFSPAALQAHYGLEKAASEQMLDAIDDHTFIWIHDDCHPRHDPWRKASTQDLASRQRPGMSATAWPVGPHAPLRV